MRHLFASLTPFGTQASITKYFLIWCPYANNRSRSEDVVRRFFDAYLHLRDLDKTLECLADDIRWIGTGDFERAGKGFCDCRELLIEEFKATPGSFDVKLRNLYSVEAGKACYTDGDMSVVDPSSGKGVNVRISAMCGEVPMGAASSRASTPPSQRRTAGRRILPYLFPWGRERAFLAVPAQRVPAA